MRRALKLALILAVVGVAVFTVSYAAFSALLAPKPPRITSPTPRPLHGCRGLVLIYDSLYRDYPNKTLDELLVDMFRRHGYCVKMVLGGRAGLVQLAGIGGYNIVVVRAHAAFNDYLKEYPYGLYVFTGLYWKEAERILGKSKLEDLMRAGLAAPAVPLTWAPRGRVLANLTKYERMAQHMKWYLAVSPRFFESIVTRLNKTILIFFTCDSADDRALAGYFLSHGASAYIGWRGKVRPEHLDAALPVLVKYLLATGSPREAVEKLPTSLRVDEETNATLVAYVGGRSG